MNLLIQCLSAAAVIAVVHFIAATKYAFLSALALSFPALSVLAYYAMYIEQGTEKVKSTTAFALLSTIPFTIFLFALRLSLRKFGIVAALSIAIAIWAVLVCCLIFVWNRVYP